MDRDPFTEFIENELSMEILDEFALAECRRRRREAISELLECLEQLKELLSGHSPYGRIPPKVWRD